MKNKKGFTLVELMVVVAIIAILAAVALPMYSTFKQKTKVGTALKGLEGAKTVLQGYFETTGSFTDIETVPANGGAIMATGAKRAGGGVPQIENMAWSLITHVSSELQINFNWSAGSGCPPETCDGKWRIKCYRNNDRCDVAVEVGEPGDDPLNMNRQPTPNLSFD